MSSLSLVTWNLFGLEPFQLDVRTEAACTSLLLEDPPDIVCFQEVIDRTLIAHLRPHFSHAGYAHVVQPATTEYTCAVFVRTPLVLQTAGVCPFPSSQMGRALLEATVDWHGQPLLILTAHMESLKEGSKARKEQLEQIVERMEAHPGPALFAGDTNLRDAEVDPATLGTVRDAWDVAGTAATRFTWRPWKGSARARFDRVFLSPHWTCTSFTLGNGALLDGAGVPISDHRQVRVSLQAETSDTASSTP